MFRHLSISRALGGHLRVRHYLRHVSHDVCPLAGAVQAAFCGKAAGVLEPKVVATLRDVKGLDNNSLLLELLPHAKAAAVPELSKYYVGAAAMGSSGHIFLGFNLELRDLPFQFTVHAEQTAIYLAADFGEQQLVKVATSTTPCGHCRQAMQELPSAGDIEIICPGQETRCLRDLMPDPFGPQHLNFTERLLQSQSHDLQLPQLPQSGDRELIDLAFGAARRSYSPFGAPAGMAVRTEDGHVAAGFAVESVAHNPGMTAAGPLQGTLVKLAASGIKDWKKITSAVLVETGSAPHYTQQAQLALERLAPRAKFESILASLV